MAAIQSSNNSDEPSDDILLGRVHARDQQAMADLFDRYGGMAYSVALRVIKDPGQAENAVQEIFFHLWRKPDAFVGGAALFQHRSSFAYCASGCGSINGAADGLVPLSSSRSSSIVAYRKNPAGLLHTPVTLEQTPRFEGHRQLNPVRLGAKGGAKLVLHHGFELGELGNLAWPEG